MAKLRFSKRLSVMVDEEMARELDRLADSHRLNRSDTIRAALRSYLQYMDEIKAHSEGEE